MSTLLCLPTAVSRSLETPPRQRFFARYAAVWVWLMAAAGFTVAALCLASLTWDGSYYLLRTLQDGVPMAPHHRWLDRLILAPVLWAQPYASGPLPLAVLHGFCCAVTPLLSLAACLAMLRGRFEPLRMWAVFGILIAPLPGQVVLVGEVTPALQAGWVALVFVWSGCPWRWVPAVLLAGAAMWGLHPVAVPLFGMAAVTALALGAGARGAARPRFLGWAGIFGLSALAKANEAALHASAYERANLHAAAWFRECFSGLCLTPFAAILPALAAAGLDFYGGWRGKAVPAWLNRGLWAAAFVLGLGYGLFPGGWTGSLCYRKFGVLVAVPLALLAGVEAWRLWKNRLLPARRGAGLAFPAGLFAVTLAAMSVSWRGLCHSFTEGLAACPGTVQTHEALGRPERDSALNHWSATSLSLVLQGWNPRKVHIWNVAAQCSRDGVHLCPGEECSWKDAAFTLGWVGRLHRGEFDAVDIDDRVVGH